MFNDFRLPDTRRFFQICHFVFVDMRSIGTIYWDMVELCNSVASNFENADCFVRCLPFT